jgi:hypothetical protein
VQVTVSFTFDLPASGNIDSLEPIILDAGRQAMVAALQAACREYEAMVSQCPRCASTLLQNEGSDRRVVQCSFGRAELYLHLLRCEGCGKRFRPAEPFVACLEGGNISARLREACVLAGASWPYAIAARVLADLCGATISCESVRKLTNAAGASEAEEQLALAERIVAPTGTNIWTQREATLARTLVSSNGPDLLLVGLDGGWVPSREGKGGMEGKVGVVASEVEDIGRGRHRLSRRRYVATFGDSERLGVLAYAAASELGGEEAKRQQVLGDGAGWIKTQADLHFPRALKTLDWGHLERVVHKAIRVALPGEGKRAQRKELHGSIPERLWNGDVEGALGALARLRPVGHGEPIAALEDAMEYIQGQQAWLGNYAQWQAEGFSVGSGLVEREVALVINRRMKKRGMRWRRQNADSVVALRTCRLNDEWDEHIAAHPAA